MWVSFLIAFAASCRPLPRDPIVESVRIRGVRAVDVDDIEQGLATGETAKLFGFIPRVLEYSTYDPSVLERDLQRIERYLRARGYYSAKVVAARVVHTSAHAVEVEIRVQEGPPVRVTRIEPGLSALPFDVMLLANRARQMAEGDILDEEQFEADRARIERALFDAGYAFARVRNLATVDLPTQSATLTYEVTLGPKAVLGKVVVVGLREIPIRPVLQNLNLHEGEEFSESDLEDAEQALLNLGVFANVEVHADRSHPETGRVPITVQVRETDLRSVRAGVGVRFDVQRLAGVFELGWEHKNFLGGMRRFSIQARPGLTLYPTRIDRLELWSRYLPESRVGVSLRQPSFLEGRTTLAVEGEYNVYPLLYPLGDDVDPRAERIIGYQELRSAVRVERAFFSHHLQVAPSYNFQAYFPFVYQKDTPRDLETVRVTYPELVTTLAFLDNVLEPRAGFSLSNSVQIATPALGGTISDVRLQPELRGYLPVRKSVIAARLTFGFLFPQDYGETDNSIQQKLLFRAFYSGGPNSNRGYPFRAVGPHGPIDFLTPTGLICPEVATATTDPMCVRPLGGYSLWEASLEARIPLPIDAPLTFTLFVDASDLNRRVGYLRTTVPHLSPGFGFRYATPVGPLRFDVGYRLPGAQALGKRDLPEVEGRPGDDLFGIFPGAMHLTLGEAF